MDRSKRVSSGAEVEPKVQFIEDLLRQLREGFLRVPCFQRPFVWTNDRMLNLLRSIRNRYPIGSLLVWETTDRYDNLDHVGAVEVPTASPPEGSVVGYLLDGHQRLSTLLGALQESQGTKEDYRWRIYYDLESESFTHLRAAPESKHFPVWKVLDTMAFLQQAEEVNRKAKKRGKDYVKRARELADAFAKYKVPVTTIRKADLNEAIEIFTLLNTSGRRMTPDQILTALTFRKKNFNLASAIDRVFECKLRPSHFDTLRREAVLRVILAALDEPIYSTFVDWKNLADKHRKRITSTVKACEDSLTRAVDFLCRQVGIASSKVLPYALQLVVLSEFFRNCPGDANRAQIDLLTRWIWVTSFSGAYMVGSSARFDQAVDAARRLANGDQTAIEQALTAQALPFPRQFHARSARVRAFALFLKSLNPRDLETGKPIDEKTLLAHGLADAPTITQEGEENLRNDPANRILVGSERGPSILKHLRALESREEALRAQILSSHAIPIEAWKCLLAGDPDGFVRLRRDELIDREQQFMKSIGVALPQGTAADDGDLDIDDEEEGGE